MASQAGEYHMRRDSANCAAYLLGSGIEYPPLVPVLAWGLRQIRHLGFLLAGLLAIPACVQETAHTKSPNEQPTHCCSLLQAGKTKAGPDHVSHEEDYPQDHGNLLTYRLSHSKPPRLVGPQYDVPGLHMQQQLPCQMPSAIFRPNRKWGEQWLCLWKSRG
jgi:hypothetical protein